MRDTEARLRQLKAIQLDPKSVRVFNADGKILVPAEPVAAKKGLIVALAAVLGLVLGTPLAFTGNFFRERVKVL